MADLPARDEERGCVSADILCMRNEAFIIQNGSFMNPSHGARLDPRVSRRRPEFMGKTRARDGRAFYGGACGPLSTGRVPLARESACACAGRRAARSGRCEVRPARFMQYSSLFQKA